MSRGHFPTATNGGINERAMAKTNTYQHFCPVARSLELVGEKWSLLIVRDLLRGPRRFTDLANTLGTITPKWLTSRLRELEAAGIVSRESEAGRREVWYSLTPAGEDLRFVVGALNEWGIRHEIRPPASGERLSARAMLAATAGFLNTTNVQFDGPRTWSFTFSTGEQMALAFNGRRWKLLPAPEAATVADLTIECTPRDWGEFMAAADGSRAEPLGRLSVLGTAEATGELIAAFDAQVAVG